MGGIFTQINKFKQAFTDNNIVKSLFQIFTPVTEKYIGLSGPDFVFQVIIIIFSYLAQKAVGTAFILAEIILLQLQPICKSVQSIESEQQIDDNGNQIELDENENDDKIKKVKGNKKLKKQMITQWMMLIVVDNIKIFFISIPLLQAQYQIIKTIFMFIMMVPITLFGKRTGCEIFQNLVLYRIIVFFKKDFEKYNHAYYKKIKSNIQNKINFLVNSKKK